ncbi:MAG: ribonuclease III [Phycisphaerales bacterium]
MTRDELCQEAQTRIGYVFKDPRNLCLALTHASVADHKLASNERLEFLGDAVLGLVACELVYEMYPSLLEGEMTKIKSTVVSRQTCATIAKSLGIDRLLQLGKGMKMSSSIPQSLSAAVLEAMIAAVYLDGGFEAARALLAPLLRPLIEQAESSGHQENFKSVLQQHAQIVLDGSPAYVVLDEKGPDHAKCFEVCVEIGARRFKSSWGQSKKQAEQQAALHALEELGVAECDCNGRVRVRREAAGVEEAAASESRESEGAIRA